MSEDGCKECGQRIPSKKENDHKAGLIKRTNRRRQAWVALISMIAVIIGTFFLTPEKITAIESIVIAYFIAAAGVVATYHGSSAYITKRD